MDNSAKAQQNPEMQPLAQVPVPVAQNPAPPPVPQPESAQTSGNTPAIEDDSSGVTTQQTVVPNRGGIPIAPVSRPVVPAQPESSPARKEQGPATSAATSTPDIQTTDEEEIRKDEKEIEAMLEKSPDTEKPKIPEEVKAAGVEHAKEDTPMPELPTDKKGMPMDFDKALITRKTYKWMDSIAWLATLVMYQIKKMNFKPKDK